MSSADRFKSAPPMSGTAIVLSFTMVALMQFWGYEVASSSFVSASSFSVVALGAAGAFAMFMTKPWKEKNAKLRERDYIRLILSGITLGIATFITVYCLKVIGSMRTLMLSYADITIMAAVAAFVGGRRPSMKAVVFFSISILLLLWYLPPAVPVDEIALLPSDTTGLVDEAGDAGLTGRMLLQVDEADGLLADLNANNNNNDNIQSNDALSTALAAVGDKPGAVPRFGRRGAAAFAAARRVKTVLDAQTWASVLLAGIFVVFASWLNAIRRSMANTISKDSKLGARKVHALVLCVAAATVTPLFLINYAFSTAPTATEQTFQPSTLRFLFAAAFFGTTVLFMSEAILGWKVPTSMASLSTTAPNILPSAKTTKTSGVSDFTFIRTMLLLLSGTLAMVWCILSSSPRLSAQGTFASFVGFFALYLPASFMSAGMHMQTMVENILKRAEARGGDRDSGKGLLGVLAAVRGLVSQLKGLVWSEDASFLPTHSEITARSTSDDFHRQADLSFTRLTARVMKHVWDDKNSRKIFVFLCINFSFMFVEIIVGWITNSLGLISDAGHMFFDNASLFIGLYASYMARWKADDVYTYGYARYEVLAGFVNAIFLVFVALSVVFEALERMWEPPEIHGEHVLPVSVLGLGVNIIGLVFFHDFAHGHGHGGHGHAHGSSSGTSSCSHGHGSSKGHGHESESHGHSHGEPETHAPAAASESTNENMHGVFLHVLADALGSVGVICSSLVIQYFGWYLADPVASFFISILILLSVFPLVQTTATPLLSRVPTSLETQCSNAVQQLSRLPDVVAVEQPHFWKHHADTLVSTVHIRIKDDADDQKVLRQAKKVLSGTGFNVVTIQIEKESSKGLGQTVASNNHSAASIQPA